MAGKLKSITVKGFKSIKELTDFKLDDLNIIIGANGAGKSNFIQIFSLLGSIAVDGLDQFIYQNGGIDSFLFNGPKITSKIALEFSFESAISKTYSYKLEITPTVDQKLLTKEWTLLNNGTWSAYRSFPEAVINSSLGNADEVQESNTHELEYYFNNISTNWTPYHFFDTSNAATMRRSESIHDNFKLRCNASNIAPFLLNLRSNYPRHYRNIIETIRLVMPFFEDFRLDVVKFGQEENVKLSWMQKGSDYPMQPFHFSDGSIRFICLVTALLQPNPPSIIIIDEPELGLHPAAIDIIAELIKDASSRAQVIIATQSPMLISHFDAEDVIITERNNGCSTFRRLDSNNLSVWLDDYTLGELWEKNVIGGGPVHE